jgi:hypothetical protein
VDPIPANELQIASFVYEGLPAIVSPRPIDLAPPESGVARTIAVASLNS